MNDSRTQHLRFPAWGATATLFVLSIVSTITSIGNQFVQDDRPIISENALVHSLRIWPLFTQAYWPAPYPRELYRPFTSTMFALEWVVGGGRPVAFRIVSILLALAATIAIYRLAKRLLDPGPAWLAAALFAVHPVHVEAVAVAVNQAELVVAVLMAVMMTAYIDERRGREGRPGGAPTSAPTGAPTTRWIAMMGLGYLTAALFKEHALLLPALMVAAELTVIEDPRPWRERVAALRPFFLVLILVAVSFLAIRNAALEGDIKGSFTAEALGGLGFGGRALTMLGVVPEWVRLFVWPAHLQADYSPGEIVAATHWGLAQTLGALSLIAAIAIAWLCRKTQPVITFGILWIGIALSLVSNMIVSTGIVLAERTLYLATAGVVIAAAGPLWSLGHTIYRRGSLGRIVAVCGLMAILGLGAARSAARQRVWHNLVTLWNQTVIDAPDSYRAQQAFGSVLWELHSEREAVGHYLRAIELYPKAWPLLLDYADKLRERGHCDAALKYYHMVLELTPQQSGPRASEVACLIYTGDYAKASREARIGGGYGIQTGTFGLYGHIADSALKANAPIGSVVLPPPIDSLPTVKKP